MSFIPKDSLREPPLKRALKSYIVSLVTEKYLTIGIRVLWNGKEDFNEMWQKRLQLENILKSLKQIVMFIDCITAMKSKEVKPGFAFWIAYDSAEFTSEAYENFICGKIMEHGFDIEQKSWWKR